MFKRRLRKDARAAERKLHHSFDLLREHVWTLEKLRAKQRPSDKEEHLLNQLKKSIDHTEAFVGKEIEDIEKNLR